MTLKAAIKTNLLLLIISFSISSCSGGGQYAIDGELKTWHTLTFSLNGPSLSEQSEQNPFLDYRLSAEFTSQGDTFLVPGFFAADGMASESSADSGNVWQVRFKPNREGDWNFKVSFREGHQIAINEDPDAGNALAFDGISGKFHIDPSDKTAADFRAHGRLEYIGERYLRFSESGLYFIKGGADSPENFLAFHEFDATYYGGDSEHRLGEDNPNTDLHAYTSHVSDWKPGDPGWQDGKGKGIIGALNYLASEGMNSVYFLTMNVTGDGDDVWPWTDHDERYRFDCSRLDQWEIVFKHMEKLGIMMHIVLQETENECLLDNGDLGVQRKLYLRELIARYSHHLAVTWNIGEENGPAKWSPVGQNIHQRKEMMSYIRKTNPYSSFIVVHTHSGDPGHSKLIEPFLGFEDMDGPSIQLHSPSIVHEYTRKWLSLSTEAKRQWVVCLDEIGSHWKGVMPDKDDPAHDTIRKKVLWGNLMAGGAGVEWYFGYKYVHADLNCEDWRSREQMWKQTRYAMDFFRNHLPFQEMNSHDELVESGYCFAKPGEVYAIYLPDGGGGTIDLSIDLNEYSVRWYDPRNGGGLQKGKIVRIEGGQKVHLGEVPHNPDKDWVCLLKKLS
jgi:hypothetical protein